MPSWGCLSNCTKNTIYDILFSLCVHCLNLFVCIRHIIYIKVTRKLTVGILCQHRYINWTQSFKEDCHVGQ